MGTSHTIGVLTTAPTVSQSLPMLLLRLREIMLVQLRPTLRTFDVTEQQARVLLVLREAGSQRMMILVEACCISLPSLSRIISKLRARNWVETERVGQDQRQVLVTLSSAGSQVAMEMRDALGRAHGETKRRIGDQQLQAIVASIQGVIDALGGPSVVASLSATIEGHGVDEEG